MVQRWTASSCCKVAHNNIDKECTQAQSDCFLLLRQGGEGNFRLGEEGELEVLSADPTASGEDIFYSSRLACYLNSTYQGISRAKL